VSIYASHQGLDHEHEVDCAVWVECGDHVFEIGDVNACTCGTPWAPLAYAGSHVLPSDDDPKAQMAIELASIPDYVDRPGWPEGAPKPWLRFSVHSDDPEPTCVLTRRQVERLRDEFDGWLEQFSGTKEQPETDREGQ
jgi:hypothetical protein